jgi:hypothetical protein
MTPQERAKFVSDAIIEVNHSSGRHLDEVFWYFIGQAGGTEGFGKLLYTEFLAAKSGSVTRQRILDMLLQLARFIEGRRPSIPDASTLSSEDLKREFDLLTQKMLSDA